MNIEVNIKNSAKASEIFVNIMNKVPEADGKFS